MKETKSFEKSMARLEEIVAKLESGELPLDDALSAFEEGVSLVKSCNAQLEEAEKKVRILLKNNDGKMEEVPFSPETNG